MIRSLVLGAALAASCLDALAVERRYDWTFTGFLDEGGWFRPTRSLSGFFVVDDDNGKRKYDKSMLREFWVNGINFAACPLISATDCSFSHFSYEIGGTLNFSTSISRNDEFSYWGFVAVTGELWRDDAHVWGGEPFYQINRWTDETRFRITPGPVPEPHTYLMMGAGLAALLGAARRRRRLA